MRRVFVIKWFRRSYAVRFLRVQVSTFVPLLRLHQIFLNGSALFEDVDQMLFGQMFFARHHNMLDGYREEVAELQYSP